MKKVLVAGASGYLGRYVVRELKRRGYVVRALVRNPDKLKKQGRYGAPAVAGDADECVRAEVTRPETLEGVCRGVDAVFSSVGITRQKDGVSFMDVDYQGNLNLLREAEKRDVQKFMYISAYNGSRKPGITIGAKERFVEALKKSRIAHIVIRPTGYFSDMTAFLSMAVKGRVYLIDGGSARMNPIHGEDLAALCAASFTKTDAELDAGGPEVFTYREMAELAFSVAQKRVRITSIPARLVKGAIVPLKAVRPHSYALAEFFLQVMTNDTVAARHGKRDLRTYLTQRLPDVQRGGRG